MQPLTPEQKDIALIKESITSIKSHLDKIKQRDEDALFNRSETNRKLDLLVNTLTDNDYNGKNGHITRLNNIEKTMLLHDTYWKVFFGFIASGSLIVLIFKLIL